MALQLQASFAIEQAGFQDHSLQVVDLIRRHRVRLNGIEMAERMQGAPPRYVDDTTGAMEKRWRNLVSRLQAVICGIDEWSSSLELEYQQIQSDCARAMQRAYARANFMEAAIKSGFQLSESDDDLVMMDLEGFPGYYMEFSNRPVDEGYAVVATLKADPSVNESHDSEVTEVACKRLQEMNRDRDSKVKSGIEVLERKPVVTRAERPASTRKRAGARQHANTRARAISIDPNS